MSACQRRLVACACWLVLLPAIAIPCTSFVLKGDGYLVFGTNYDNSFRDGFLYVNQEGIAKRGWELSTKGECAKWVSKYGSLTFSLAGYQLPWAGMNTAGLVLSTMALAETRQPAPDGRCPLTSPLWMQYLLDTCATVEEVIATDKVVRISGGVDHYLVGDRTGDCVAIEFLDGKTVFHRGATMPVQVLANDPYAICADQWKKGVPAGLNRYDSRARFARVDKMMRAYGPDDPLSPTACAFQILASVASSATRWSIVFDIRNLKVAFRTDRNQEIRNIDLANLDFSSESPVTMLDVHADLKGDVEDEFFDYDHEESLALTLRAVKHFRPDMTEETVRQIYQQLEDFAPPRK
ncbi:MAG: linear amide C-N hydrolase [Planctomycetota bacterium]